MKTKWSCRIASGLLLFFAAAHTYGVFHPTVPSPEAAAVREAMGRVQFPITGMTRSYADFYFGFGLLLTVFLAFAAWLSWRLGELHRREPATARPLLAGLAACVAAVAAISWGWFFVPPAVVSSLAAVALTIAALS